MGDEVLQEEIMHVLEELSQLDRTVLDLSQTKGYHLDDLGQGDLLSHSEKGWMLGHEVPHLQLVGEVAAEGLEDGVVEKSLKGDLLPQFGVLVEEGVLYGEDDPPVGEIEVVPGPEFLVKLSGNFLSGIVALFGGNGLRGGEEVSSGTIHMPTMLGVQGVFSFVGAGVGVYAFPIAIGFKALLT